MNPKMKMGREIIGLVQTLSRFLPRVLITATLAATLAFLSPVFVDRREYTAAVVSFVKNPTVDSGMTLALERHRNQRIALITHLAIGAILFTLLNVGWSLFHRRATQAK